MQDPRGDDVVTRTHDSAIWADIDPRGAFVARRAKWAKLSGPTGIVGPSIEFGELGYHKAHRATRSL